MQTAPQRSSTDHHQNHYNRQISVLLLVLHLRGYLQLNVRVSQHSATNHKYPSDIDHIGLLVLILKSELDAEVS